MYDLNIIHYYHSNCNPLNSITELPEKEAFEMAEIIGKNKGTSFNRFNDFINYYPLRIKTEEYLYNWFIKSGGIPKTKNPLYFVLEGCNYLYNWFEKGNIIKISLSEIDIEHISFTIGDSCSEFNKGNLQEPFLKNRLYDMLNGFNGDIKLILDNIYQKYGIKYIECQLWDNKYIKY